MVYEQREAIDSIEDNIEVALTNEHSGHSELVRAADRRVRLVYIKNVILK
ncbi:unnamed protein product [Trichobilharzia regenti]|nr:unnamed protein product [Trichobilharzia regenti]